MPWWQIALMVAGTAVLGIAVLLPMVVLGFWAVVRLEEIGQRRKIQRMNWELCQKCSRRQAEKK